MIKSCDAWHMIIFATSYLYLQWENVTGNEEFKIAKKKSIYKTCELHWSTAFPNLQYILSNPHPLVQKTHNIMQKSWPFVVEKGDSNNNASDLHSAMRTVHQIMLQYLQFVVY
jgi:hypothetical protein